MQWPTCMHSDDTSGHEPDCSITILVNLISNLYMINIKTYTSCILNLLCAKVNLYAFMQTTHQDEPDWYNQKLVIFELFYLFQDTYRRLCFRQ
jgi:hypothetical protein